MHSLVRHCTTTHYADKSGVILSKRKQNPPKPAAAVPDQQAPPAANAAPAPSQPTPPAAPMPDALASQNAPAVVRKRGYRVIPIPPAVEKVASRAQSLLLSTTGLLFCDVVFQVPRSEDEALAVIRGAVADLDKSEQNQKLFYLSWAHSQFFQAEMAAIGYKFIAARVRNSGGLKEPPPANTWLTLRLLTRAAAAAARRKRKMKPPLQPTQKKRRVEEHPSQAHAPQVQAPPAPAPAPKNSPTPPPIPKHSPKKLPKHSPQTHTDKTKQSPSDKKNASASAGQKRSRIIDTIDLT